MNQRLEELLLMFDAAKVIAWAISDEELLEAVIALGKADGRGPGSCFAGRMDEYPI